MMVPDRKVKESNQELDNVHHILLSSPLDHNPSEASQLWFPTEHHLI